jgi:hypothetical protein
MWKNQNDGIFSNKEKNIEEMVDQIKPCHGNGLLAKGPCLLYEWKWSPFDCFHR